MGCRQLGQNVERRKHEDGLREALEVAADAARADLGVGDEHEHHHRPRQRGGKVARGGEHPHQAQQAGKQRRCEKRRHERAVICEFFTHIAVHEILRGLHQEFSHHLPPAHRPHLQVPGEEYAQPYDDERDQQAVDNGGGDGDSAEDRDGKIDARAGMISAFITGARIYFTVPSSAESPSPPPLSTACWSRSSS